MNTETIIKKYIGDVFKANNLFNNGKVAILFENKYINNLNQQESTVLTAFGYASEVIKDDHEMTLQTHLLKHPAQYKFLLSTNCAIFRVVVHAYQLVRGIDDVQWWNINE